MRINYVSTYTRYLQLLARFLVNLQSQTSDDDRFLDARLSADMFPLKVQAKVAASFALRACSSSKSTDLFNPGDRINSLHGLVCYLNEVVERIQSADVFASEMREDTAGFKSVRMNVEDYLNDFSLPNFFFHISMVYAIAKHHGFSVTKGDFDGIHEYPEGFNWETHEPG